MSKPFEEDPKDFFDTYRDTPKLLEQLRGIVAVAMETGNFGTETDAVIAAAKLGHAVQIIMRPDATIIDADRSYRHIYARQGLVLQEALLPFVVSTSPVTPNDRKPDHLSGHEPRPS